MAIKHLIGGAALVLALGACGKGKGGGSSDVDAFMKLDTDKGVAFAVGGDDCVAKAKSVGDWRKAHTAEYKVLNFRSVRRTVCETCNEGSPIDFFSFVLIFVYSTSPPAGTCVDHTIVAEFSSIFCSRTPNISGNMDFVVNVLSSV